MVISHGVSGSWFNPATDGQGFVFDIVPASNTLVAYWFTYNGAGDGREWYIAVGDISGAAANIVVYRVEDGVFDQATAVREVEWGSASVVFSDCTHANLDYQSDLDGVGGIIPLQRLTLDVSCLDTLKQAHITFVTQSNSWLDAQGSWLFEGCVELGPSESHGRELFWFDGAALSFEIDHYNSSSCQGPMDVQSMSFELIRVDKTTAILDGDAVIANRVLLKDTTSSEVVKQIFYFDVSDDTARMAHGNFNATLDAEGYPAELHNPVFLQQP